MIPQSPRHQLSAQLLVFLISVSYATTAVAQPDVSGNATIRAQAGVSEIVVRTTSRLAGAIDSLTWNGKEFINSEDHGRQLQSAWNADDGQQPIADETYNPTEAGSRDDGSGTTSSSRLLFLHAENGKMETLSRPAYWLRPGQKSGDNLARNRQILSDHLLRKRVTIGYRQHQQVLDYLVTISLPSHETHHHCVMEALTAYMPAEFDHFWALNLRTESLEPLSHTAGEQEHPVVLATAAGDYAMGAWSPGGNCTFSQSGPSYGRFAFETPSGAVMKWNCVYRVDSKHGLSGDFNYRIFVAVGRLDEVKAILLDIQKNYL